MRPSLPKNTPGATGCPPLAGSLSILVPGVAVRQHADCRCRNSPLPRSTRPFMTAIDFAAFVDELAAVSGETIRPFFRSALSVENKSRSGGFDPVTAADRAAEAAMRALIKRSFPEHGVVGEEFGADRPDSEYVWVLDPIDGTKSFICGMPAWGTLIALTHRGTPVLGMMHQPFIGERFFGD